jgi:hypothetical protein
VAKVRECQLSERTKTSETQSHVKAAENISGNSFQLERYKYILQQMNSLNESVHKYLALFQTLGTAVVGSGAVLFLAGKNRSVDIDTARLLILFVFSLFLTLAAFVVLSVLAGILSWLDYRREEVALLDEMVRPGFRSPSRVTNLLRWYETYVLLFVLITIATASIFTFKFLLPNLK